MGSHTLLSWDTEWWCMKKIRSESSDQSWVISGIFGRSKGWKERCASEYEDVIVMDVLKIGWNSSNTYQWSHSHVHHE